MKDVTDGKQAVEAQEYYFRKLAKSGNTRYISVNAILPKDWRAVKVYVDSLSSEVCILRIIPVR